VSPEPRRCRREHPRCQPAPVLLRPHLLHPEHRPSQRDLNVHFNASLDPFFGLPCPSMPSWRATHGEPPAAFCLKSEPPSTGATPRLFPRRPTTVGRPNFTDEPPASGGGGISLPCSLGWTGLPSRLGRFGRTGRVLQWTEPKVHSTVYQFPLDLF
jgi:hypothetical protein